jgi:hypothetical protein
VGLRAVIGNAIDVAFRAADDVVIPMTYRHYGDTTVRDMDTGEYSRSFVDTPDIDVIIADAKLLEGRANVTEFDSVLIIRGAQVPVVSIGDFVFTDTAQYECLQDVPDPTTQLHQIAVRTSKIKLPASDNVVTIDGGGAEGGPMDVIDGGGA